MLCVGEVMMDEFWKTTARYSTKKQFRVYANR
jgi:hypothetical protein